MPLHFRRLAMPPGERHFRMCSSALKHPFSSFQVCAPPHPVLPFQPKYRLAHPENALLSLSYTTFSGSTHLKLKMFNFENKSTIHIVLVYHWRTTSTYSHDLQTSQTWSFATWIPVLQPMNPKVAYIARGYSASLPNSLLGERFFPECLLVARFVLYIKPDIYIQSCLHMILILNQRTAWYLLWNRLH